MNYTMKYTNKNTRPPKMSETYCMYRMKYSEYDIIHLFGDLANGITMSASATKEQINMHLCTNIASMFNYKQILELGRTPEFRYFLRSYCNGWYKPLDRKLKALEKAENGQQTRKKRLVKG